MLPERRALAADDGVQLLKGVIAQCIEEYYRTDGGGIARSEVSDSARMSESSLSFMLGPLS